MAKIENHYQLSDHEFENQFELATLHSSLFTHEAHLRLAWIHIRKYGLAKALQNIEHQLINYVNILGASDKFNKTLTIAAINAVHHFIQKSKSDTFQKFILEFPRLKYNFKELIGFHYAIDIFNSEQAKKEYLEPDLLPFS